MSPTQPSTPFVRASPSGDGEGAPAALGRILAFAVAALLLVGSVTAGRTYVWCVVMERTMSACCMAPEHGDALAPGQLEHPEVSRSCCEQRTADDLAKARAPGAPFEVPPPLATLAPAVQPIDLSATSVALLRAPRPALRPDCPIRAGPSAASDTCVRLQVFRC
jgi:hypothetical protein